MLPELKAVIEELPLPMLTALRKRLKTQKRWHTLDVLSICYELILDDIDTDPYISQAELDSFVAQQMKN